VETVESSNRVKLTSAERVLYPDDGITKGDLFAYYADVAPTIVPHLRDRPFTLKRYPHGITADVYFQKQVPRGAPAWLPTREFTTHPREGGSRQVDFALVNSRDALLWMVQMNCVDMNAWYSRVDRPDRPDYVVFDLDPPDEPDAFAQAIEVAHLIRGLLDEVELPGYVKTSGADGIHVLAPIQRRSGFGQTYEFAEAAARLLEQRHPGLVTTEWLKRKRNGVLVDHRQNGWGKTIASVYSVRPKPGAPVSTPLAWEELTPDVRPRDFTMDVVLRRLAELGDLFEPVLGSGRPLGPAVKRLAALAA
jgi:bifunctional non-homologous end joining protein LigD